ncbi:MAG: hypothetical protein B6I18_02970 [Bacteroidetes bacterium 4572_112]|nr:MAG: hypothetical protein B6I18_02970 [Bacteroidetes bacterium 4572_112]
MDIRHLTEQEIATYAEYLNEGTLDKISSEEKEHIKNCDACNNEIIAVADILEQMHKSVVEESITNNIGLNISKKKSVINYTLIGIAASIILAAVIIMLLSEKEASIKPRIADQQAIEQDIYTPVIDSNSTEEVVVDVTEKEELEITIPDVIEEEELLAYICNDDLEQLSARYNTALRGDIEITTDSIVEIAAGTPYMLQWNTSEAGEEFIIEIYDNKAQLIIEESVHNSYEIRSELKEGLYYWKLINSDFDLLFCGKIIIR